MTSVIRTAGAALLFSSMAFAANADDRQVGSTGLVIANQTFIQVAETTVKKDGSLDDEKAALGEKFEKWSNQISEKSAEAVDATGDAADDTSDALDEAWEDVTETWEALQESTEENWDAAKVEYEDALVRLEKAWNELTSDN